MIRHPLGAAIGALVLWAMLGPATAADLKDAYQSGEGQSGEAKIEVEKLIGGPTTTIVGEAVRYPGGLPAEVLAAVVTLPPGKKTGWHRHGVPIFGYILSGELRVDYGDKGQRTYKAGDGFMEAMAQSHEGINDGDAPVRILVVYMGADGMKNVIPD